MCCCCYYFVIWISSLDPLGPINNLTIERELKILSSNVRGIVHNWEAVTSVDWNEYDLLAFNEIWAVKDFESLKINGFEIKVIKTWAARRGGGVAIFGRSNLKTEFLETTFIEGVFESVGIKIGSIHFVNIYRPPSGKKQTFCEELSNLLESLNGSDIILSGDFNINFLERNIEWENLWTNLVMVY